MSSPNGRFDLNAKRREREAAAREAARERFSFEVGDPPQQFTLAPITDWPADYKRMLDNQDIAELVDAVIDDPDGFWAVKPRPSTQDVIDIIEAVGQWSSMGADLGESAASPQPASIPT